jgi:ribosome biogenesis protein Nip4
MIPYRDPLPEEWRVLRVFEREFRVSLPRVLKGRRLIVSEGRRREVSAVSRGAWRTLCILRKPPYYAGLTLGEVVGGKFLLGLEGAHLIAPFTDRWIQVNERAEQLVLYGRDVFSKSVIGAGTELKKGDRCLILNPQGETIAIGEIRGDGEKIRSTNLLDRGWYLRKGE